MRAARERIRVLATLLGLAAGCEPGGRALEAPAAPVAPAQGPTPVPAAPSLGGRELSCEHEREPLDLDTPAPRFSWKLAAIDPARRGMRQGAYRILVASSADELAGERGDLWDSGRVASAETVDVEY